MKKCQSPVFKRAKSAWRVMHRRCTQPKFKDFPRYGGAGVKICPQWSTFQHFLQDMGLPPTSKHWLGRLDVLGHYTPDNCIWTLPTPQKNRRNCCVRVQVAGDQMTVAQASQLPGKPTGMTIARRWRRGFSLDAPKLAKIYKASQWLTYQGECLPAPEWARRMGLRPITLWQRINAGWPVERALTTPLRITHQPKRKPTHV